MAEEEGGKEELGETHSLKRISGRRRRRRTTMHPGVGWAAAGFFLLRRRLEEEGGGKTGDGGGGGCLSSSSSSTTITVGLDGTGGGLGLGGRMGWWRETRKKTHPSSPSFPFLVQENRGARCSSSLIAK